MRVPNIETKSDNLVEQMAHSWQIWVSFFFNQFCVVANPKYTTTQEVVPEGRVAVRRPLSTLRYVSKSVSEQGEERLC